jgi:predicted nucleic acid-binding Zn ribbon protein
VQSAWTAAVGERIAEVAQPVAEREGELVVACRDPVWTEELNLMQEQLLERLRERLGDNAPRTLRFRSEDFAQ